MAIARLLRTCACAQQCPIAQGEVSITCICVAWAAAAAASWRAASAFQCSATLFAAARCSSTCKAEYQMLRLFELEPCVCAGVEHCAVSQWHHILLLLHTEQGVANMAMGRRTWL